MKTIYSQYQVLTISKTDQIHKRSYWWAVLPNYITVRITRKNYEAIKKAWHGATDITEAGLASRIEARGYHAMCALQLGISLEAYAEWQGKASEEYQQTGKWLNFYDYRRELAAA